MNRSASPRVAIVGGGLSGAAVAFHLVRETGWSGSVVVIEPRQLLGSGLAYDTPCPVHRINVPASKMSLFPDDEADFARWLDRVDALADDPEAVTPEGHAFPRRALFGRYVADRLLPYILSGGVEHVRDRVVDIARDHGRFELDTASGLSVAADMVVLATTHPAAELPPVLGRLSDRSRVIADALDPDAFSAVAPDDAVLVLGMGLTGADAVATLLARGHRGPITAISRRGLRSRGHAVGPVAPAGDYVSAPSRTALALLRRVRIAVADGQRGDRSWHGVFDALRTQGGDIWRALPVAERRRLVRHLRPYWDAHRFRVAPQIEQVLDRAAAAGQLTFSAARLVAAVPDGGGLAIGLRDRRTGQTVTRSFDRVVVTTGPAHGTVLREAPLASLAFAGWIRRDPCGLGIDCDHRGRAIGERGVVRDLFVAGPLARGTFGELMGLPQVTAQAALVAGEIAATARNALNRDVA